MEKEESQITWLTLQTKHTQLKHALQSKAGPTEIMPITTTPKKDCPDSS